MTREQTTEDRDQRSISATRNEREDPLRMLPSEQWQADRSCEKS